MRSAFLTHSSGRLLEAVLHTHPIVCLSVFYLLQTLKNVLPSPLRDTGHLLSSGHSWLSLRALGIFINIQSFRQRLWCLTMALGGRGCWLLPTHASSWHCHAEHIVWFCCQLWPAMSCGQWRTMYTPSRVGPGPHFLLDPLLCFMVALESSIKISGAPRCRLWALQTLSVKPPPLPLESGRRSAGHSLS